MDPARFDGLTKSLAAGTSRRRVLRALLGAAAGMIGIRQAAGATSVTGTCHAYCQPLLARDRRPCYDACLTCGGDTAQLCQADDGSFSCCPAGTACSDGTCQLQCGDDYKLCEGITGSHCCPNEGSCNIDGTCLCLPNGFPCSSDSGTCNYCCSGQGVCDLRTNECYCACLPTGTSCSLDSGTCDFCCNGQGLCDLQTNECQCL